LYTSRPLSTIYQVFPGAHTEETSEDKEEAELDEAWDLQLLVTVARVKALFGYSKDKQDQLIKFAQAPSGVHAKEMSEDKEEAELDEAWDLNAAEVAPTEFLVDHEENDSFE
jgi:hypothetical protein